jgi:cytosine/adenosine deaminase-related metal-dependent hydrolase
VVETEEAILRDSERLIDRWHDASRHSMRRIVLAPCSPFSVSRDLMRLSAELARERGCRCTPTWPRTTTTSPTRARSSA